MGQLSFASIVTNGLQKAGDTSLTTYANVWLNAFLRETYRDWPWPFLHKRTTGIALAAGTTSLSFGAGSTETLEVPRIFDPIKVYTAAYTGKGVARIRQIIESDVDHDAVFNDTTQGRGIPTTMKIQPDASLWGKWTLRPWPVPDKAYLLGIEYLIQPADISNTALVPMYPNDRTMILAVEAEALNHMHEAELAMAKFSALQQAVVQDRLRYGSAEGINEDQSLDDSVFR
jgi:hypothetical protein